MMRRLDWSGRNPASAKTRARHLNLDGLAGLLGRLALTSAVVVVLYGALGPSW